MNIGYINTYDIVLLKKNTYKLYDFIANDELKYISYKGKLKGKIILVYKKQIPQCNIIDVIGIFNDENISKTLKYMYNINRKKINDVYNNEYENSIYRKHINKNIFSIDPKNSIDIDDALSYDNNIISVYIAQPIVYLNENIIMERCKNSFSTLYEVNAVDHLWGDKITNLSSLFVNIERPAYCIDFEIKDFEIINIISYPCYIINTIQTDYDTCLNFEIIKTFYELTKKIMNKDITTKEMIEFWMIKTNTFIGNNFNNIPFKIVKEKYNSDEYLNMNDLDKINDINIKNIFVSKILDSSLYSYDYNYHKLLNIKNYTHFTSPIRRIIDTIIHFCITYNINFKELLIKYNISLDDINIMNKSTNKFHKEMNILKFVNNTFNENIKHIDLQGYVFSKNENKIIVYFHELGFIKVKVWDKKFDFLFKTLLDSVDIGYSDMFSIYYKKDFLPKNKLWYIPKNICS